MTMAPKKAARNKLQPRALPSRRQRRPTTMRQDAAALLTRARHETWNLSEEVRRMRTELDDLARQISKSLEASQQDVQHLSRCLQELEQLVRRSTPAPTPAVSMHAPSSPPKSLFTFLGRPSLAAVRQPGCSSSMRPRQTTAR